MTTDLIESTNEENSWRVGKEQNSNPDVYAEYLERTLQPNKGESGKSYTG